jgi:hypothetical protein
LVARFVEVMSKEFEMSMMGELQFFLRLQIKQAKEGTFVHQAKYTKDIRFSVCLCTRFQVSPRTSHRQAVKRIFRYLRYTPELGLWYSASSSPLLLGFSDADFVGCRVDRKSTSGTCQFLGSSLVSWSSRKQSSVA